jgi:hypothetical protein
MWLPFLIAGIFLLAAAGLKYAGKYWLPSDALSDSDNLSIKQNNRIENEE